MKPVAEFVRSAPFVLVAHRGASGQAPENTIAAISRAVESGVAMIELDIQLTKDNDLVVFHDAILGRTTNGHGHINNTPTQVIRSLDAGSWFSPEFQGEQIPLLDEALDVIENKLYLNCEIKPLQMHNAFDALLLDKLVHTIRKRGLAPYIIFSSFDHNALHLIKNAVPEVHTVALHVPGDQRLPHQVISACKANGFGCSVKELTKARVNSIHEYQIPSGVYTVNTESELNHVLKLGVIGAVTNNPQQLQSYLNSIGKGLSNV